MVDIQSATAEGRKIEETTGQKYNGGHNYRINSNQILHSDKYHRTFVVTRGWMQEDGGRPPFVDAFVNERLKLLPSNNDCLLASSP